MAGYSGTPLAKKLGIKAGSIVLLDGAPPDFAQLLQPLPADVRFARRLSAAVDLVHLFARSADELRLKLPHYRHTMRADAMLWVSWPKRASKVVTDIDENVIRALALPLGLVDVKVCAVDATWSALKLVIRVEYRATH